MCQQELKAGAFRRLLSLHVLAWDRASRNLVYAQPVERYLGPMMNERTWNEHLVIKPTAVCQFPKAQAKLPLKNSSLQSRRNDLQEQ